MNKKIIISLSTIGIIAALAIGGTIAYLNDTETSTGNIFTAGTLDLKVDHLIQTYNGINCNTCSVEVYSSDNTGDMVVERNGSPLTPYSAVLAWTHSTWMTATSFDPSGKAKWIWEHNPTQSPQDTQTNTSYSFEKTFTWMGPITGATLDLALGSDNMYTVYLNGNQIGQDLTEKNFLSPDHITSIPSAYFNQGINVLKFVVTNKGVAGSTAYTNPAGLIYKFTINGECDNDYFKQNCQLWASTDLTSQHFFNFQDVKPGDWGTNVISLTPQNNDAWACMIVGNPQDNENDLVDPETEAGDVPPSGLGNGELSQFLSTFVWWDTNQNGVFDGSETQIDDGTLASLDLALADSAHTPQLQGGQTQYIGLAWCFGNWTSTNPFVCDGSVNAVPTVDQAQTDSFLADLIFYVEQSRNNGQFQCGSVSY